MMRCCAVVLGAVLLAACAPQPPAPSAGHIQPPAGPAPATIPEPVRHSPVLPPPRPVRSPETYTVVVNEVPVKELLFALARDAGVNVDIHPDITGTVTLNALDQTLVQILGRLTRQLDLRYELVGDDLVIIAPDLPHLRSYNVDYVNMSRDTETSMTISTQVVTGGGMDVTGGGGSGGSQSSSDTRLRNTTNNRFWETLEANILAIVASGTGGEATPGAPASSTVIVNREAGVVTVRATARQHEAIGNYIDRVLASAHRQVLIEATVVEVLLNQDFQAGIDWATLAKTGFNIVQASPAFQPTNISTNAFLTGTYMDGDFTATVRLLDEFGDARVLSSPKLMALNNQTALLKVVDNEVYFTIEATTTSVVNAGTDRTFDTTPHSVPVGFIMNVTPQIGEGDGVTLNVRPTLSRIVGTVLDPNPALAEAGVTSEIPIVRVREMESVLTVDSGQTAVLGGLMQNTNAEADSGIPFVSDLPVIGDAFTYRTREYRKSELVIFLRPTVIRQASIQSDLKDFRPYLEENLHEDAGLSGKEFAR